MFKETFEIKKGFYLGALLLAFAAEVYFFQKPTLNKLPQNTHTWAQADRYALALGFVQNDFNFFEPQTWVLNKQFPNDFKNPSPNSKTAVEFPIHDFIPAVLMQITGCYEPVVFRWYILLYGFLGLLFLFRLTYFWIKSLFWALLVTLFAMLSPVFIYYNGSFLPTIPSLSNSIIGLYFYLKYLEEKKTHWFFISFFALTLAALSRMPFAIYLIAIGLVEFYYQSKAKFWNLKILFLLFSGYLIVALYFFYNRYLTLHFGSMFLGRPLPPESMHMAIGFLQKAFENWKFQYFSMAQYFILGISIALGFMSLPKQAQKKFHPFYQVMILSIIGVFFYCGLMLQQFVHHDYYFLDTLYLPIILLLVFCIHWIREIKLNIAPFFAITFIICICFSARHAYKSQKFRWQSDFNSQIAQCREAFESSDSLLNQVGWDYESKVLVLNTVAPNVPFNYLKRKGFAVMTTDSQNICESLQWDYDVIAIPNIFIVNDIFNNYPDFIKVVEPVASNKKLTLFKRRKSTNDSVSIEQFIGIDHWEPAMRINCPISAYGGVWTNIHLKEKSINNNDSIIATFPDNAFGPTFKLPIDGNEWTKGLVYITGEMSFNNEIQGVDIVVTVNSNGQNYYYSSRDMADVVHLEDKWNTLTITFQLPEVIPSGSSLALYFWNKRQRQFYIRSLMIKIY